MVKINPVQGFDRLREAGLDDEEIANLRTAFHRFHGNEQINPGNFCCAEIGSVEWELDDEVDEQTRILEDAWMENDAAVTLPDGGSAQLVVLTTAR